MLKAVEFGPWTPDLASANSNHLVVAENVYPIANGYAPARDLVAFTDPLSGTLLGGASFIASDGTVSLLVSANGYVAEYDSGSWTNTTTTVSTTNTARFCQFGDNVLVADGGPLQGLTLPTLASVSLTDEPDAVDVAGVRDFVMVLTPDNKVQWSQFNNSATWTTGTNQADYQPILSSFGVRLVGGEYGLLLKKMGITRITYVGPPTVFQFDEIAPEIGCMAAGSVCNVGRLTFFLSERGFEMCDGETVTPISDEMFNRWLFSNFSREDLQECTSAIDPRNSRVMWALPGNPGKIIVYNWVLKRASVIKVPVTRIFAGYSTAIGLEDVDTLYPGGIDLVPVSLDSPLFNGGNPLLLLADNDNAIGSLSGDTLEATIQQNNIELTPAKRSRIRHIRPITDATSATATLDARMRAGDAEGIVSAASMISNGKMPVRANGRYVNLSLTVPAGEAWSYVQGCEFEFEAGDGR